MGAPGSRPVLEGGRGLGPHLQGSGKQGPQAQGRRAWVCWVVWPVPWLWGGPDTLLSVFLPSCLLGTQLPGGETHSMEGVHPAEAWGWSLRDCSLAQGPWTRLI